MAGSLSGMQLRGLSSQAHSVPGPCLPSVDPSPFRRWTTRRPRPELRCPIHAAAASNPAFESSPPDQPQKDYQPFPRLHEGNAYRLLGLGKDASFEEVQEARNHLYEEYRWHEPSREAIELAFESILSDKYKHRMKTGFKLPRKGKYGTVVGEPDTVSLGARFRALFDPTISTTTLINEAFIYVALGLWGLFSSDQSFPLAGAFAYSVYKFQNKRIKANPEGPHFGGNPIVGALFTTGVTIGVACALMAVITAPLQSVLEASMRQVGACLVIIVAGVLGVYIK